MEDGWGKPLLAFGSSSFAQVEPLLARVGTEAPADDVPPANWITTRSKFREEMEHRPNLWPILTVLAIVAILRTNREIANERTFDPGA